MIIPPSLIAPLMGFLGTIIGIFLHKFLNRKKDTVEYQTQIIRDLYQEIGRVKEQIEQLKLQDLKSKEEKKNLLTRIDHLEQENRKQAHEIKELRRNLNAKP